MTNLQRIRKEKGLTQKQLAEKSGVNLKLIQKYETGERNINHARVLTVYQLVWVLRVDYAELLEADEEGIKILKHLQKHI